MAWSIFTDGGGDRVAVGWADQLLKQIGAPVTPGNTQFVYDWEVSEGGGGKYNPLNQGPVPGHPELTSTGQQYGGGAADFVSWQAGLTGAQDYLQMGNYSGVLSGLRNNDPVAARTALIASPWAASHYGNGSSFSNKSVPGGSPILPPAGSVSSSAAGQQIQTTSVMSTVSAATKFMTMLSSADFWERAGLILFGAVLIIIGVIILAAPTAMKAVGTVGAIKGAGKTLGISGASGGAAGPTTADLEDRERRLTLAERNAAVGESKVATQQMRERRLALGARAPRHASGSKEPNPAPRHSVD
jgi:hypothetical protein